MNGGGDRSARSPRVAARQLETRRRILEAARLVLTEQGFAAAQVAVVASVADVATGSIYRHFPSKGSLFTELLREVCRRELDVVTAILTEPDRTASARIGDAVATFVDRALRGGGLSYSVIVEPMDPDIDQVRLEARASLADAFASAIEDGMGAGEFEAQDATVRGAAIVGAFLEGVVRPLTERPVDADRRAAVGHEIAAFCQTALAAAGPGIRPDLVAARPDRHRSPTPARTAP